MSGISPWPAGRPPFLFYVAHETSRVSSIEPDDDSWKDFGVLQSGSLVLADQVKANKQGVWYCRVKGMCVNGIHTDLMGNTYAVVREMCGPKHPQRKKLLADALAGAGQSERASAEADLVESEENIPVYFLELVEMDLGVTYTHLDPKSVAVAVDRTGSPTKAASKLLDQDGNISGLAAARKLIKRKKAMSVVNKSMQVSDVDHSETTRAKLKSFFDHSSSGFNTLGIRKLNLSGNSITHFPSHVARNLPNIKSLDLSRNKLRVLPPELGNLSCLSDLNLSLNCLEELPHVLSGLSDCNELNLFFNSLVKLPESIGEMRQLRTLDLGFNNLAKLPDSIGDLSLLSMLVLNDNKLEELPESIGNLSSLSWLDVSDNSISVLPAVGICSCTSLSTLRAQGNRLQSLPENMGVALPALRSLNVSRNKLAALPVSFGRFSMLETLLVSHNALCGIPSLVSVHSLLQLDLSDNNMQVIPSCHIGCTIHLEHNPITQTAPPAETKTTRASSVATPNKIEERRLLERGLAAETVKLLMNNVPSKVVSQSPQSESCETATSQAARLCRDHVVCIRLMRGDQVLRSGSGVVISNAGDIITSAAFLSIGVDTAIYRSNSFYVLIGVMERENYSVKRLDGTTLSQWKSTLVWRYRAEIQSLEVGAAGPEGISHLTITLRKVGLEWKPAANFDLPKCELQMKAGFTGAQASVTMSDVVTVGGIISSKRPIVQHEVLIHHISTAPTFVNAMRNTPVDVGKNTSPPTVRHNGHVHDVEWISMTPLGGARPSTITIDNTEPVVGGRVSLSDGSSFKNPLRVGFACIHGLAMHPSLIGGAVIDSDNYLVALCGWSASDQATVLTLLPPINSIL